MRSEPVSPESIRLELEPAARWPETVTFPLKCGFVFAVIAALDVLPGLDTAAAWLSVVVCGLAAAVGTVLEWITRLRDR